MNTKIELGRSEDILLHVTNVTADYGSDVKQTGQLFVTNDKLSFFPDPLVSGYVVIVRVSVSLY